jgi:hypothetical protein
MRKQLLLGSAAVLVILSHGATAQTNTGQMNTAQTSGSTTAPAAQQPAPSAPTGATIGTTSGQNSPSGSTATPPNAPRGTTSQATPPSSSPNATGSGTSPNTTQNSGGAATNPAPPAPASSGTAERSNAQAPSGQVPAGQTPSGTAAQTRTKGTQQTPSTQQQAIQPNTNAGTRQATQPQATQPHSTQPNTATRQNAQRNEAPGGVVSFNVQQRSRIGQAIARHNVRPVTNVNFSIAVGTAVPRSVRLSALPADLATFVPQYRGYSYFVVEEQIVIVEPSSTQIVAVIPFSGGSTTRTAAPAPTKSRAVKLNTQEREVVRRHTSARRSVDAPAPRRASRHYSVGDEVETTEIIETFPETVYREAPSVRPYRYFRQDNNVILVDPEDHRVVDVFD